MSDTIFRTGKNDRPTCDLREGEVVIVVGALRAKALRVATARDRVAEKQHPVEYQLNLRHTAIMKLAGKLANDLSHGVLANRDEVNLAAEAVQDDLVAMYRLKCQDPRIKVLSDLLQRIRIGWKRIPAIPAEVLAQIYAREDKRFWAPVGQVSETEDVYRWFKPQTELPYVWVG